MKYADIIVDISLEKLDKIYQYEIPASLQDKIQVGSQVSVSFGRGSRIIHGFVVGLSDTTEYDPEKIKPIQGVVKNSLIVESQLIELAYWIKRHYGSTMNEALKTVLPVKRVVKARVSAPQLENHEMKVSTIILNEMQKSIIEDFIREYYMGIRRTYLLHGVTGSGKTQIYMEMSEAVIKAGKQVIFLIPEIALTYQMTQCFYQRFGERVAVLHSRLSQGERYEQYSRAKKGEIDIVIGPRSALFMPFSKLGLIVLDEEHENSYKSEKPPKYHARETAIERAKLTGASVVLGSATPSLESYHRAQKGEYKLYQLTQRAGEGRMPKVHVVDLREELKARNKSIFSRMLHEMIEERLKKREQILLFINRRGYAGFVSCRSCGHVMKCPHCDVSMTVHDNGKLMCHYCGYTTEQPKKCPQCGSTYIAAFGTGTQKVEELVHNEFPKAKVLRMDADTTTGKEGHRKIISEFAARKADILVGTQMIVKGHDFPNVTLVGIMAADLSLYANDYRASERTFQLLEQAEGRAGRAEKSGDVVVQTYNPEHYSIEAARCHDYLSFFQQEMSYRTLLGYPPTAHILAVLVLDESKKDAETAIHQLSLWAKKFLSKKPAVIIGPTKASLGKMNDIYRRVMYIKSGDYSLLMELKEYMEEEWKNAPKRNQGIQYDFNPMSNY